MNKSYFSVNNWLVDISSGSILHLTTGERKRLGEYQLKLLDVFIQNTGIILTREELTNLVWERRVIGNNSLPNAIHALRSALEDDGKQQRIIKTIPKKGYLLEAEYCCSIIKDESEVKETNELFPESGYAGQTVPQTPAFMQLQQEVKPQATPQLTTDFIESRVENSSQPYSQVPVQQYRRLFIILIMVLMATAIACSGMWYFLEGRQNRMLIDEQETNAYSNIHLYKIAPASTPYRSKDKLSTKIKDTLYQLNQMLKAQSVNMNVYYLTIDQTLNYTFSLENRCDSKQLAMAIYHWRIDTNQLNNLILRETKRKLNDMAICPNE